MLEVISQFEYLEELQITNCSYVTGGFLSRLKSSERNLKKLNFRGSYQIEFSEIVQCVKNNSHTLRSLVLDGEGIQNDEFLEAIQDINKFDELSIYFGEGL